MRTLPSSRFAWLPAWLGKTARTGALLQGTERYQGVREDSIVRSHPRLVEAFRVLDQHGSWVLLRGEDDLISPSGDVDILVSKEQLRSLDSLLKAVGFSRVLAPGHGGHRFYFSYSQEEDLWLKLDIVSDIRFGNYQQWKTAFAGRCLGSRIRKGPVWLPEPADQAWLQLLHLFLDKGQIQPARVESACTAGSVASLEDDVAKSIDQYMGPGTARELLGLVRSGSFDNVPALAARMRKRLTGGAVLGTTLRGGMNRSLRVFPPILQGRRRRGLVVGAMGPDGAGKTSLLRSLGRTLPVPGSYVYMGLWSTGPGDALLRRIPGGRLGKKVVRIFRGSLLATYHHLRGRLVLLDRVPHDTRLPGSLDSSLGGRISAALAFALGPAPDVLLVLDAPGEVMFARKGEHSVEELEAWRLAYRELAQGISGSWILDASQPLNVVRRQATGIVWNAMVGGTDDVGPPRRGRGKHRHD